MTKGLAHGLGSKDNVTSPTFTIAQVYNCSQGRKLYHFDFYRLDRGGMVSYELSEALEDPKGIIVVEWGDVVEGVLPEIRVNITMEYIGAAEDSREITIEYPESWTYLLEKIK